MASLCGADMVYSSDIDEAFSMRHLKDNIDRNQKVILTDDQGENVGEVKVGEVKVIPYTWGVWNEEILQIPTVDLIIASDCFYDNHQSFVNVRLLIQRL